MNTETPKVPKINMNSKVYDLKECVLYNDDQGREKIGRLDDYDQDKNTYECFTYLYPEQTPEGRSYYHGKKELVETSNQEKIHGSQIVRIVYVVSLRDYQKLKEENNLEDVYLKRQEFEKNLQQLVPKLSLCQCGRVANPDDYLILCDSCERSYCVSCLKQNTTISRGFVCLGCRFEIPAALINQKYELYRQAVGSGNGTGGTASSMIQQQSKPRNVVEIYDDEEEEEEFTKKRPVLDLEKLSKKIKKNDLVAVNQQMKPIEKQDSKAELSRQTSNQLQNQQPQQPQQPKIRSLKNVSLEKQEKINRVTEKYKQTELSGHGNSLHKKRLEVRERFFQILLYGVEELRDIFDVNPLQLSQQERHIAQLDDGALFLTLKKLILEIEVALHIKLNYKQPDRIDYQYLERCKIIYMHLKDEKNLELRRKVLTKEFSSQDLVTKDETEFFNPELRKETMERTKLNFDLDHKPPPSVQSVAMEEEVRNQSVAKVKNGNVPEDSKSKYVDAHFYKTIQDQLPKNHMPKVYKRIRDELPPELAEKILGPLKKY